MCKFMPISCSGPRDRTPRAKRLHDETLELIAEDKRRAAA
jgi:hypothetical protein